MEFDAAHDMILSVRRFESLQTSSHRVSHAGHTLSWVMDGSSTIGLEPPQKTSPGCFVVIPAGVPHQIHNADPISFWGVKFCASCLQVKEDDPLMTPFRYVRLGASAVVRGLPERASWVEQLFEELQRESQQQGPGSSILQRSLLMLILGELRRAMVGPMMEVGSGRVARALDFVWRSAFESISLKDVARAVHCSPKHLAGEVKKATGATVGDWIRATRVSAAANWLLHSDASMDDIANRVGWKDTTHFIRQFRKVHGRTPAAWRRMMRAVI